jgi:hypothetical protein
MLCGECPFTDKKLFLDKAKTAPYKDAVLLVLIKEIGAE